MEYFVVVVVEDGCRGIGGVRDVVIDLRARSVGRDIGPRKIARVHEGCKSIPLSRDNSPRYLEILDVDEDAQLFGTRGASGVRA